VRLSFLIGCILFASWSQAQPSNTWILKTDDTSATVAVEHDRPVLKQLRSPKTNYNWITSPISEPLLASVVQDGRVSKLDWKFRTGGLDSTRGELMLQFENTNPNLGLRSIWRARPGHGPIEHWLTITNNSGSIVTIGHQDSLVLSDLSLPSGKHAEAWWINRGGSNASTEGGTFTEEITDGFDQVLTSDPSNGSSPVPWFAIQTGASHGLYVGWEFSGIGRIHAKTTAASSSSQRLDMRVGNISEFKTDLQPNETFLVPPAFAGCYSGDIDDGSYTLHRFVLEKLLPTRPKGQPYPTLAYNLYLDAGGDKAREEDVLRSAATCKGLGFETFVPDAMWFPQAGDWRWDPARFPHSFLPIEQYVHQNQMQFGLWVAWTQGGNSSDPGALSFRNHPDWFVKSFPPDQKMDYLHWNVLIDLGYDPAREWAERETERVVSEFKLDYLKHDYSPIVTECEQTNHRHRYRVDVSYWSTLGYYGIQEKLRQKFPDLILEGCSGGGHIKDFGYIRRVHYIVTTDTLSSLPDRQSFYDSTFVLPPAVLQAYTYENYYNKDADRPLPYFWRSAMMGAWQIDPTKVASWSEQERAGVKKATELYKSWIRPMLQDVQVHHILPRPDGYHWDGMFYWSPPLKHGTLYIFRPNNDQVTQLIRLKGLQPQKMYRIRSEDGAIAESTRSGADLMKLGLKATLPSKYSSDLVFVEEE
jgi:alpha-galactosidase